jgi:hypothetical protein
MDEQRAIETIIQICESETGFAVQLRVHNTFDEKQYHNLIEAIKAYDEVIGNAEKINRRVAGDLFHLDAVIGSQVHYYEQIQHLNRNRLQEAYAELWALIAQLLGNTK